LHGKNEFDLFKGAAQKSMNEKSYIRIKKGVKKMILSRKK
jgi:hypothetical protein